MGRRRVNGRGKGKVKGRGMVGLVYLSEELGANNAATTPHQCNTTIVELPLELLGSLGHENVPLRVRNDL